MAEFRSRSRPRRRGCELMVVMTTSELLLVGCVMLAFLAQTGTCSSEGIVVSAADRVYLESFSLQGMLSFENTTAVVKDWGQMRHLAPAAVVYPTAVEDVATIVQAVARSDSDLTIAARGVGHSINGQAQVISSSITTSQWPLLESPRFSGELERKRTIQHLETWGLRSPGCRREPERRKKFVSAIFLYYLSVLLVF